MKSSKEETQENPCSSPSSNHRFPTSSSCFNDISNFKTPRHHSVVSGTSQTQNTPKIFTASRKTPWSSKAPLSSKATPSHRRRLWAAPSSIAKSRSSIKRLKDFEIEQSKSSRKEQIKKEKSLRSLARSLTAWLNFLFENPAECGCGNAIRDAEGELKSTARLSAGKRDSCCSSEDVRADSLCRWPKRQREGLWRENGATEGGKLDTASSKYTNLQKSLADVCSFDDLKERMREYLSLAGCTEIFSIMSSVTKNIDEGRLRMKPHCPLVTDVGMKKKSTKVLMSYNPTWLKIGLYIVFGGESLLAGGELDNAQDTEFLKLVVEKQLYSHASLAKAYAYNKSVEGLYRPGYFERLGNVILKRFLLLVLILDQAKLGNCLPLKYGLDGKDGGSPLLFNTDSNVKSSCQMITDFLTSELMYGEGNVLSHLLMIGYKVSHQQLPLVEYEFRVEDLFEDMQDGIRLCRAIHLLQCDSSILMKLAIPTNNNKKKLANCSLALQYLKKNNVPLHDEEGMLIDGEDIFIGDKGLTLSLLWNMFVHLQLPLLVNKTVLSEEISNISKTDLEQIDIGSSTHLEMLLNWIKAVCGNYEDEMKTSATLMNGKAMWCLLDYYFRKELHCSCSPKGIGKATVEESIVSSADTADAVHNFVLSQKLTTLLGNVPAVLQTGDIVEHNGVCNDRSVVVLLVFLSSQLLVKKSKEQLNFHKLFGCDCQTLGRRRSSLDRLSPNNEAKQASIADEDQQISGGSKEAARKFRVVKAWWQEMAQQNRNYNQSEPSDMMHFQPKMKCSMLHKENAAVVIQAHIRGMISFRNYRKLKKVVIFLQSHIRAWLMMKYIKQKQLAAITIQKTFRGWLTRRHHEHQKKSIIRIQSQFRGWLTRRHHEHQKKSVIRIQSQFRGWLTRRHHEHQKKSVIIIQSQFRGWLTRRHHEHQKKSVIRIQSQFRGLLTRKNLEYQNISVIKIQSQFRGWLTRRHHEHQKKSVIRIQSQFRGLLTRKNLEYQNISVIKIQSNFRGWRTRRNLEHRNKSVIRIQSNFRGWRTRRHLENQNKSVIIIQGNFRGWLTRLHFEHQKKSVIIIQRAFRQAKLLKDLKQQILVARSVTMIQSCIRRWKACKDASMYRHSILLIQSHTRGWLARKVLRSKKEAATLIQSFARAMICSKAFDGYKLAAIRIQRFARASIARTRLLGGIETPKVHSSPTPGGMDLVGPGEQFREEEEPKVVLSAVVRLQRRWKTVLMLKSRAEAAILIQSHVRGWIARQKASKEKHLIVLIQAHWKGYLARKDAKGHLVDLRLRVQNSAANAVDGMRLIDRHIAALNELLSMKSLSNIRRCCATLDKATGLSSNCCEILVNAGAIGILVKQIMSVSRSIPDQEILKHTLSILRNLARYPHLTDALIDHPGSVQTILWELLRNKEEGYFIACNLMRKICSQKKGVETVQKYPNLLKRLHALVDEHTRKASKEKRNAKQRPAARDETERRLREASDLLRMIARGR